jgi:virginiamycin A acetyltransferase
MDSLAFKRRAEAGMRKSRAPLAFVFLAMARAPKLRSFAVRAICRLEGGRLWSATYREMMRTYYRIEVGLHSYGPGLVPGGCPPGTRVGNYCSLADGLRIFRRNHPVDRISQHPFFFNSALGLLDWDTIPTVADNPLTIGHDVWIGQNVIIAPGCRTIGHGAVIASGAVVAQDVPNFAIVGGVPAKLIRWRFSEDFAAAWLQSEWWLKPITELAGQLDQYTTPIRKDATLIPPDSMKEQHVSRREGVKGL